WLGDRDSNPDHRCQRPTCLPLTPSPNRGMARPELSNHPGQAILSPPSARESFRLTLRSHPARVSSIPPRRFHLSFAVRAAMALRRSRTLTEQGGPSDPRVRPQGIEPWTLRLKVGCSAS